MKFERTSDVAILNKTQRLASLREWRLL